LGTVSERGKLTPYLSPIGAWAFSLGTTIGWGSLVVTSNTYLLQAGPWGSALGLVLGAIVMIIMAKNYHYLINRYPDCGGAYTFVKKIFGYDHAFLVAWFLALTYFAMFWANDTSLPLFARYFLGDTFQFGLSYSLFGFEVHIGEVLLCLAGIAVAALACLRFRKLVAYIMVGLAFLLIACILVCFIAVAFGFSGGFASVDPAFIPDQGALSQVLLIACISPWAFIGFEGVSQHAEEFAFPANRAFRIMVAAIAIATVLYLFILFMSVSAYPARYGSWLEYIADLGNLSGIEGLPAFYAAYCFMGDAGVGLLMIALLALVLTSLFGNIVALSRLLHALAKDDVLPSRFSGTNEHSIPGKTVVLVALVSAVIPFLGRTAISWIVDVTTIGATVVYGFVAAATLSSARKNNDEVERITGGAGLVIMMFFLLCLILPNFLFSHGLAAESYFLFTTWGILGFLAFRFILRNNRERFGKSMVVWIGLLSLVVVFSFTWMNQSIISTTSGAINDIRTHYLEQMAASPGSAQGDAAQLREAEGEQFVEREVHLMEAEIERSIFIAAVLFAVALVLLLSNYSYITNWARRSEEELDAVKDIAMTDSLTHVKSRHAFREFEKAIDGDIAKGTVAPFAVVVCDLNKLKQVNDSQGHEAGNDYIKAGCMIVCEIFDHSPVFRVGGDEFVALLRGRDYDDREALMKKLQDRSRSNAESGGVVVASGVSRYRAGEDSDVRSVFERADARMYEDKRLLKAIEASPRLREA